ncbi:MAG: hypothetical protein GY759_07535 [Chloroflexi bacterium]|nr:hypothetical protein [Chloroflexota bacterium]
MHSVILCMETGKMYYMSEMGDSDEVPDDIDDVKRYISIPHKNDLELGSKLVFDFTAAYLPEDLDSVYTMFRRRGAYFRFRRLLESRGLLQSWYDYENQRTKTALLEWCVYSGIDVKE